MILHEKPDVDKLPGFWEIKSPPTLNFLSPNIEEISSSILILNNLISKNSCDELIDLFLSSNIAEPVSVNGLKNEKLGKGSKRASGWSEELSVQLSNIIIPKLNTLRCKDHTPTDWHQLTDKVPSLIKHWSPVGISPLLRFMRYEKNSEHFPHYDAGYFYPDGIHRTLKSIVIYLTTNKIGATRFIKDNQEHKKIWDRDHSDWNRRAKTDEILYSSFPEKGKVLIFDHRACHDVQKFDGQGDRIIIRGDIIYKAVS